MNSAMKRLFILGATGKTGRPLVEQALQRGHTVTAMVRDSARLDPREGLTVVQGDVFSASALTDALRGHDAALTVIGAPGRNRERVRERSTQALIEAMGTAGLKRLVAMSTYGASETKADLPAVMKYVIVPVLLGPAFKDHDVQEACIRESGLTWTIVRPTGLSDGPPVGTCQRDIAPGTRGLKWRISRADVASTMLDLLDDEASFGRAISISN